MSRGRFAEGGVESILLHQLLGEGSIVPGDALRFLRALCINETDKGIQIKGLANFLDLACDLLSQFEESATGDAHRIMMPFSTAIKALNGGSRPSGTHRLFSARNWRSYRGAERIVAINRFPGGLISQFLQTLLFLLVLLGQITLALFKLVIGLGQVASFARRNEC